MKNLARVAALTAAILGTSAGAVPADLASHFGLSQSSPEAGTTVETPAEIRLWFTEEPQDGTASLRLPAAEEAGVEVTGTIQDADDPTSFYVELRGTLPPGTYTVSWRGMGQDGHVVRDAFEFTVGGD